MFIKETHEKYKNHSKKVVEVVGEYLDNIDKYDKELNCFISLENRQKVLDIAKNQDEMLEKIGFDDMVKKYPLFGIVTATKDIFTTKDLETTAGSNILKGYIPSYNATVFKKLVDAGAINIGKVNNDAFAHGGTGKNSDFGPAKNPYNKEHYSGGSSSGSGVSVASNFCNFSICSDTGGSVRNPASYCNMVGLKPTYGRVSRYGVIAMASSLDSIGHITKTVEDNAYILNITAGYDPNDATSSKIKVDNYLEYIKSDLNGKKIGIIKEFMVDGLDLEIKSKFNEAKSALESLGAEVVEISIPKIDLSLAAYYIIVPSEVSSNLARFDGIRYGHNRDHFGDEAIRRIMIGTYTLSAGFYDAYYNKAIKLKNLITNEFLNHFKDLDAILAPVVPSLPPKIGDLSDDPLKEYLMDIYTVSVNLAGLPSLSIPIGFSENGLPVGIQLIGNYFEETKLYNIGYHLENKFKSYLNKPNLD